MKVTKLKITAADPATMPGFALIAYMYPGETEWRDPHGGTFSSEEQRQLTTVARGDFADVLLHVGTKYQRLVAVRFAAEFG
mgnify:CR=1 FL=1